MVIRSSKTLRPLSGSRTAEPGRDRRIAGGTGQNPLQNRYLAPGPRRV